MGLFDLFSNDSAEKARDMANAGAAKGYGDLSALYGQGRDAINTGASTAQGYYAPLIAKYGAGADAYGDAAGANGTAGFTRAKANFQSDPGYGFQMDQGLQALQRTHAAAGNLNSGNADTDTLRFSQGLADQSYGNYVSRLAPYLSGEAGAVGGAANTAMGQGTALNASYMGQGGAANATDTAIGNNDAGAELNNYKIAANLWNGITNGFASSANAAGGAGGAKSLFSAFAK